MKNKKNKVQEIKLKMKFNPGTMSYEPILPPSLIKKHNTKKWTKKTKKKS